jgi:hypothetical protein
MIIDFLKNNKYFKEIVNSSKYNIKSGSTDFLLSSAIIDFKTNNKTTFVILPNLYEAQKAYDKLT